MSSTMMCHPMTHRMWHGIADGARGWYIHRGIQIRTIQVNHVHRPTVTDVDRMRRTVRIVLHGTRGARVGMNRMQVRLPRQRRMVRPVSLRSCVQILMRTSWMSCLTVCGVVKWLACMCITVVHSSIHVQVRAGCSSVAMWMWVVHGKVRG